MGPILLAIPLVGAALAANSVYIAAKAAPTKRL